MVKSIFSHPLFNKQVDTSQFTQLTISDRADVEQYSGGISSRVEQINIELQIYYDDEVMSLQTQELVADGIATWQKNFRLIAVKENKIRRIAITRFPIIIGSSSHADIRVKQSNVSAQHAIIQWDPITESVFLIDNSKSGTYVNGEVTLGDGNRIYLQNEGHFQLTKHERVVRFLYWNGTKSTQELDRFIKSTLSA
jgi:hypothetical protein